MKFSWAERGEPCRGGEKGEELEGEDLDRIYFDWRDGGFREFFKESFTQGDGNMILYVMLKWD